MSVEVGLRRQPRRPRRSSATDRTLNVNQPTLAGFPNVLAGSAQAVLREVRLDAGHRRLLQLRRRTATTRCRRSSRSASRTATRSSRSTRCSASGSTAATSSSTCPISKYGPADWDRVHSFSTLTTVYELPFWHGESLARRLAVQSEHDHPERPAVQRQLPRRGRGPRYRPEPSEPDRRSRTVRGTRDKWFNAAPIGDPNSAFSRPAVGTFGEPAAQLALRARPTGALDVSLFKTFRVVERSAARGPLRVGELLQPRESGQPRLEIGVPGNHNANAGRITSTAYGGTDPQRNFQFALKYRF